MISNKTKHNKYSQDWQKELQWLANSLPETDKTQLNQEITEIVKLQTETQKLATRRKSLKNIVSYHRGASEKLAELNTNYSGTGTKKPTNFLNNGTNQYNWWTKIKTYLPLTYANNLYEGTVNQTPTKLTEPEAIKLLTRVIKAFEKIDETKFGTKFTASTHTSGTNHLPEIQKLAQDGLKDNKIIGKDAHGKDLPDKGQPANHQHLNRLEYSFKSQFVADADIQKTPTNAAFTPQATETITKNKVDNFFAFIDSISKDGTINPDFLTELQSDNDILKNIENNTEWKILPAQNTPWEADKLANYGIKVADNDKTKLYLSETSDKAFKFEVKEGLKSWVELVHSFFPTGSSQRIKLASSFQTDPCLDLLTEIAKNTHATNWELPEDQASLQEIVDQLEIDKINSAVQTANLDEQISQKTDKIKEKESEIVKKIQAILTKKREELAQHNIKEFDNEIASGGQDHRKTYWELFNLQKLLLQIRYLEKEGDTTVQSSITEENTALAEIEKRLKKLAPYSLDDEHSKFFLVEHFINHLSLENGKVGDWKKAISEVKKEENRIMGDLNTYLEHFSEYEKVCKLNEQQQAAKNALETELGKKPDENEKLSDWQSKLKALDPLLTETVITEAVMKDWQTQENFKTSSTMEAEIKKVFTADKKLEESFAELIKKEDAQITDIAKLFEKKNAKEIITLIRYWEYDKLEATEKEKQKQKIWWTLEKKDPENAKKYLASGEPTEAEIKDILYQVAIGTKTLRDKVKEDEQEQPDPFKGPNEEKSLDSWWKFGKGNYGKPLLTYGGILLVLVGLGVAIFWKQINNWWKGPEELEGEATEESSEDNE